MTEKERQLFLEYSCAIDDDALRKEAERLFKEYKNPMLFSEFRKAFRECKEWALIAGGESGAY